MRIIGVDLHARQQTIAMLDTDTGELMEKTLGHDGDEVRNFYSALRGQVLVGIEATGSMHWFLKRMQELGIECRVGHPQKIRKAETRKQKHDRRDALLLLKLLAENRFPTIWMPSTEQRDLRTLLRHRHGCACGVESNTPCNPWHSQMVCDEAAPCGARQANANSRRCRCLPMRANEGQLC
jgi:transposase